MDTLPLSAVIFHVSRCGSTLLSQLLSLSPQNVVLSEVPFFDEILRKVKDEKKREELLEAAIALYSQRRNEHQAHVVIKTDSWHIFFYKYFRKLFPQTPFFLLYRHPEAVILSQQKRRGLQAVPGLIEPHLFGFGSNELEKVSLDDYMAKVLQKYFTAFSDILQTDALAIPINYSEGASSWIEKLTLASAVSFGETEWNQVCHRSRYHAKYPDQVFAADNEKSQPPICCPAAVAAYEVLEGARRQRDSLRPGDRGAGWL